MNLHYGPDGGEGISLLKKWQENHRSITALCFCEVEAYYLYTRFFSFLSLNSPHKTQHTENVC